MELERRGRVRRSHARSNWKQEDLDACDRRAVWSACLPDGSRVRRESHARFCERPVVKFRRPTHPRDAASDATGAVMGLPNTRIVPVRERCAVAGNGGPDCQAAATAACRGKGFSTGKSLDTQSEQKCPAQVL